MKFYSKKNKKKINITYNNKIKNKKYSKKIKGGAELARVEVAREFVVAQELPFYDLDALDSDEDLAQYVKVTLCRDLEPARTKAKDIYNIIDLINILRSIKELFEQLKARPFSPGLLRPILTSLKDMFENLLLFKNALLKTTEKGFLEGVYRLTEESTPKDFRNLLYKLGWLFELATKEEVSSLLVEISKKEKTKWNTAPDSYYPGILPSIIGLLDAYPRITAHNYQEILDACSSFNGHHTFLDDFFEMYDKSPVLIHVEEYTQGAHVDRLDEQLRVTPDIRGQHLLALILYGTARHLTKPMCEIFFQEGCGITPTSDDVTPGIVPNFESWCMIDTTSAPGQPLSFSLVNANAKVKYIKGAFNFTSENGTQITVAYNSVLSNNAFREIMSHYVRTTYPGLTPDDISELLHLSLSCPLSVLTREERDIIQNIIQYVHSHFSLQIPSAANSHSSGDLGAAACLSSFGLLSKDSGFRMIRHTPGNLNGVLTTTCPGIIWFIYMNTGWVVYIFTTLETAKTNSATARKMFESKLISYGSLFSQTFGLDSFMLSSFKIKNRNGTLNIELTKAEIKKFFKNLYKLLLANICKSMIKKLVRLGNNHLVSFGIGTRSSIADDVLFVLFFIASKRVGLHNMIEFSNGQVALSDVTQLEITDIFRQLSAKRGASAVTQKDLKELLRLLQSICGFDEEIEYGLTMNSNSNGEEGGENKPSNGEEGGENKPKARKKTRRRKKMDIVTARELFKEIYMRRLASKGVGGGAGLLITDEVDKELLTECENAAKVDRRSDPSVIDSDLEVQIAVENMSLVMERRGIGNRKLISTKNRAEIVTEMISRV